MPAMHSTPLARHGREIVAAFLPLGLTAYGGSAMMGLRQPEIQEKRRWVPQERCAEGLSLVNMLLEGLVPLGVWCAAMCSHSPVDEPRSHTTR